MQKDISRIVHDGARFFSGPVHFSGGDWVTTGILTSGTLACFPLDESMRTISQRNRSHTADRIADLGDYYGNGKYAIGFSGLLYAAGSAWGSRQLSETGILVFESVTFAGLSTTILKTLFGRSRPNLEEGSVRFRGLQFDNDYLSLPSGHATVAFALSSVLAKQAGTYSSAELIPKAPSSIA